LLTMVFACCSSVSCVASKCGMTRKAIDVYSWFCFSHSCAFSLLACFQWSGIMMATFSLSWRKWCIFVDAFACCIGLDTSSQQISFYCGSVHFNP
jgi:hypothetical protein